MKILLLYNELKNTCGVSKHLMYMLEGFRKENNFEFYIICGGGDAVERYYGLCKEVIVFPEILHVNRSIKNFLSSTLKIYKFVKLKKINIIHSHYHYVSNIAEIVRKISDVKTVQTIHGLIPPKGLFNHFPSKNLIAVNENIIDYLNIEIKVSKKKIYLIRSGISINDDQVLKNSEKLKIIAASRMVEGKGVDLYIRAVANLPKELKSKCEFYFAGKGILESELLVLNHEMKAGILFLGDVIGLTETLWETHIFVFPSKLDEGFPIILIEAGLTNNLVISSNISAIRKLFKVGIDIITFEIGNLDDLKNKLRFSIENYSNLNSVRKNYTSIVKNEFDLTTMVSNLSSFYEEITN